MGDEGYSNKELKEMFDALKYELIATQYAVKKYNGVPEKIYKLDAKMDTQIRKCDAVQAGKGARSDVVSWLLRLWPVALSALIYYQSTL